MPKPVHGEAWPDIARHGDTWRDDARKSGQEDRAELFDTLAAKVMEVPT
jgi:hypothetical protein